MKRLVCQPALTQFQGLLDHQNSRIVGLTEVSRVENLWSWTEVSGVPLSWAIVMCSILLRGP